MFGSSKLNYTQTADDIYDLAEKALKEAGGRNAFKEHTTPELWGDGFYAGWKARGETAPAVTLPPGLRVTEHALYFGEHCMIAHDGILKDRGPVVRTRYKEWVAATLAAPTRPDRSKDG